MGAEVFISCGQREGELQVAEKVKEKLDKLGYQCYVALKQQDLGGVRENIFKRLDSSDYFIFIDFKRERLKTGKETKEHRGSLFCQQELAIASYLHIPALAFQEDGLKPQDGLLQFVQANPEPFKKSERDRLPDIIERKVKRDWDPTSKNKLTLTRFSSDIENHQRILSEGLQRRETLCRWFLIDVRNNHKLKHAINCYAYLESARDLAREMDIPFETAELKWQGYILPNASIMAKSHRRFAGFYVPADSPRRVLFDVLSDSQAFFPRLEGCGPFELGYVVLSENFPLARGTFRLSLADRIDDIRLDARGAEGM